MLTHTPPHPPSRDTNQRQRMGLAPPSNSPWTGGAIAPNAALLAQHAAWVAEQFALAQALARSAPGMAAGAGLG